MRSKHVAGTKVEPLRSAGPGTRPRRTATPALGRLLAAGALLASAAPGPSPAAGPQDSVVQVTAEWRVPSPVRPWAKQSATLGGTGVVIDGQRILTSAHILLYATEVTVQAPGGDRFDARVAAKGIDVDLAVLTLEDPAFFRDHPPLPRAPQLPDPQSQVIVYGFPIGGNGLAVTRGIISRIQYTPPLSGFVGLLLQVDAAINPGNSGGPALVDGQMVGVAFSRLSGAESIGFIIPNREIDAFLADIGDGAYRGKPTLHLSVQAMENKALRAKLGLDRSIRGVVVNGAGAPGGAGPVLQPFDVLTHIGEHAIDNEGMVAIDGGLRLPFHSLLAELERDAEVPLKILRGGKALDLRVPVTFGDARLIPSLAGRPPSYFVCGPLVFSPASAEGVEAYFRMRPDLYLMNSPLSTRGGQEVAFPGEQLVVVTSPAVPLPIMKGYGEPFGQVVRSLTGIDVRNLAHLVERIRDSWDEFLVFRSAEEMSETLVFKREEFLSSTEEAMQEAGITHRGSDDLLAIWGRPAAPRWPDRVAGTDPID